MIRVMTIREKWPSWPSIHRPTPRHVAAAEVAPATHPAHLKGRWARAHPISSPDGPVAIENHGDEKTCFS